MALKNFLIRRRTPLAIGTCAVLILGGVVISQRRQGRWEFLSIRRLMGRVVPEPLFEPSNAMLRSGNPDLKEVAITFDDGPHIESREQILEALRRYKAKATFFEVGMRMGQYPDLLRKTITEGHEIANHTMFHQNLPGLKPDTLHKGINDTDIAYYRITGKHLRIMRPPGMRFDRASLDEAKRLGYIVVSYTAASADYGDNVDPKKVAERTLRNTKPGGILLLHDYTATAIAMPEILENLSRQGYKFVTVSEMIAHLPQKERELAMQIWKGTEEKGQLPRPSFLLPSVAHNNKPATNTTHAEKTDRKGS